MTRLLAEIRGAFPCCDEVLKVFATADGNHVPIRDLGNQLVGVQEPEPALEGVSVVNDPVVSLGSVVKRLQFLFGQSCGSLVQRSKERVLARPDTSVDALEMQNDLRKGERFHETALAAFGGFDPTCTQLHLYAGFQF